MTTDITLPQTFANEQAVIAAVLDDGNAYAEASQVVSATDFSTAEFSQAWTWMAELFSASRPVTMFSLAQAYSQTPGWLKVQEAISLAPSPPSGQTAYVSAVLADRAALRRTVAALLRASETAAASTTFNEARPLLESLLMGVFADAGKKDIIHIRDAVAAIKAHIANPGLLARQFRTGFPAIDAMCKGGPRAKHLMVVAGKSGEGKTTLALNIISNMAMNGIRCGVFSLEMDAVELTQRAIFSFARSSASFEDACQKVENMEIHISDNPDRTVESVRAAIKLMVMRHKVQVVALDYIQLLGTLPGKENRERQVANMSRALKIAAKESDVFVIALSQLNEDGQLRESRAIEQDADEVLYVVQSGGDHYLWLTKNRHGAKHGNVKKMAEDVEDEGIEIHFDSENFRFTQKE